jgi:hypothetical protein
VHPIHAIHERLRGVLGRLPDGLELYSLCRVAPGRHYNVTHLVAVELCERQGGLERVSELLPEDFVAERAWLCLACRPRFRSPRMTRRAATAAQLARDVGFAPVVAGPLSASARFDRGTALSNTLASHSQAPC